MVNRYTHPTADRQQECPHCRYYFSAWGAAGPSASTAGGGEGGDSSDDDTGEPEGMAAVGDAEETSDDEEAAVGSLPGTSVLEWVMLRCHGRTRGAVLRKV